MNRNVAHYLAAEDDRPGDKTRRQRHSLGGAKIFSRFRQQRPCFIISPHIFDPLPLIALSTRISAFQYGRAKGCPLSDQDPGSPFVFGGQEWNEIPLRDRWPWWLLFIRSASHAVLFDISDWDNWIRTDDPEVVAWFAMTSFVALLEYLTAWRTSCRGIVRPTGEV